MLACGEITFMKTQEGWRSRTLSVLVEVGKTKHQRNTQVAYRWRQG